MRGYYMDDKTKTLLNRAPEIVAAVLCDKTMECCGKAKQCPYHSTDYNHMSVGYGCDVDRLDADTAGLLKAYAAQLAAVTAERDAAVESWCGFCAKCKWNGKQYLSDGKMDDRCKTCRESNKCNWDWRGPQGAGEAAHE